MTPLIPAGSCSGTCWLVDAKGSVSARKLAVASVYYQARIAPGALIPSFSRALERLVGTGRYEPTTAAADPTIVWPWRSRRAIHGLPGA